MMKNNTEKTPLLKVNQDLKAVISPNNKGNTQSIRKGGVSAIHKALNLRTRKSISAFRKKGRDYTSWRGRVGVHIEVDSIDLEDVDQSMKEFLHGWEFVNHFDVIQLTCVDINIEKMQTMEKEGVVPLIDTAMSDDEKDEMQSSVLHDAITPQIFIFSFGAVVFWNFPDSDMEKDWLEKNLLYHPEICGQRHDEEIVERANDEMAFEYTLEPYKVRHDVFYLNTRHTGEKLAASFALAKSSLLAVYEVMLERNIERNANLPEQLAKTGRIHMSDRQLSKEIGSLFLIKHGINLDSNLQDTPEEFWDNDRFQESYDKTMSYFEIIKRINLINQRIDMISDLHRLLIEQEQNRHGVHLEWIIIVLIVFEVLAELINPSMFWQ